VNLFIENHFFARGESLATEL